MHFAAASAGARRRRSAGGETGGLDAHGWRRRPGLDRLPLRAAPARAAARRESTPAAGRHRRGIDDPWYAPAAFVHVPGCASRTDCPADAYGFAPFAPGNAGRNRLDGPGLENLNASLAKRFAAGTLNDAAASGQGGRRVLQFVPRYEFRRAVTAGAAPASGRR
jgi:hypothetical protein